MSTTTTTDQTDSLRMLEPIAAWAFVLIWGSGFIATKIALQYTTPLWFITLRFALGVALVVPLLLLLKPQWPSGSDRASQLRHMAIAGLMVHGVYLCGSHYAQYLGLSAGGTALVLAAQPLITALIFHNTGQERLRLLQWAGIALGLIGVLLLVWHKLHAGSMTIAALLCVTLSLLGITCGSLYQRTFLPQVDLRASTIVQFIALLPVLATLALSIEGPPVVRWSWPLLGSLLFLVIFASVIAVNAFAWLMRRGQATRVSSLVYLTPLVAVGAEWLWFDVKPTGLTWVGIVLTCGGVALLTQIGLSKASSGETTR